MPRRRTTAPAGPRALAVFVRWGGSSSPRERVQLPSPMTEGEARRYLRGLLVHHGSGSPSHGFDVILDTGEAAPSARCPVCGLLLRLHSLTLPQFAGCYRG